MKISYKKYFYLVFALLLNTFASLHANVTFNSDQDCYSSSLNSIQSSVDIDIASFKPLHSEGANKLLFDQIDCEEIENEESTSKRSSHSKDYYKSAFSTSKLQLSFFEELNKSNQHSQWVVIESTQRLHLLFQVFII